MSGVTIKIPQDIIGIIGRHKNVEKESIMLMAEKYLE
jgi:hypothetical protein